MKSELHFTGWPWLEMHLSGGAGAWEIRFPSLGKLLYSPGPLKSVRNDAARICKCTSYPGLALRASTEALPGLMVFFKATVFLPLHPDSLSPCICDVLEI